MATLPTNGTLSNESTKEDKVAILENHIRLYTNNIYDMKLSVKARRIMEDPKLDEFTSNVEKEIIKTHKVIEMLQTELASLNK